MFTEQQGRVDHLREPILPESSSDFWEQWYQQSKGRDGHIADLSNYGPYAVLGLKIPEEQMTTPEFLDENLRAFEGCTRLIAQRTDEFYTPALREKVQAFRNTHVELLTAISESPAGSALKEDQIEALKNMCKDFYELTDSLFK